MKQCSRFNRSAPEYARQEDLFDRVIGPHNYTETSRGAAVAIGPKLGHLQDLVLALFQARGRRGATNDEIARMSGLGIPTVCARRNELMKLGLIEDSGERRKTASGRNAQVWVINQNKKGTL